MKMLTVLRNLTRFASLGVLLAGCILHAPSPTILIKGVVRDALTGRPLAGAGVADDEYGTVPYQGATTDAEGRYEYSSWYEEHQIVASAAGYEAQSKLLKTKLVGTEKEKIIDFDLMPKVSSAAH